MSRYLLFALLAGSAVAQDSPASADPVAAFDADDAPPDIDESSLQDGDDGLRRLDIVTGDGGEARKGSIVSLRLRIWTADGEPVLLMTSNDDPIVTPLGAGALLPGLESGVQGMSKGSRRYLHIPTALAYGSSPPKGAPAGDLIAVVQLVDVQRAGAATGTSPGMGPRRPPESPPQVDAWSEQPNGVKTADLVVGDGARVQPGSTVRVEYTGWVAETGERFDSSYSRDRHFSFEIGGKQVIPGWEIALRDMNVGGHRVVHIPAYLAYASEAKGNIPAYADLIFEIKLIGMD